MSDRHKVGVVGVGFMGQLHASNYAMLASVDLVAVSDIDAEAGREVADRYQCRFFENNEDMIGLVDAVSIAVPSVWHLKVAEPFIKAGVHILMEKPLASTVEEAQRIVDLSDEYGVSLLVGHQERFNSAVMALADRLIEPKFVNAERLGQFAGRNGDVDVITDLMIHDIDLILTLMKSSVKHVSAVGASVITDHVDIANARLEFESGAVANVTASRVSNEKVREFKIYDGSQHLTLDLLRQRITSTSTSSQGDAADKELLVEPIAVPSRHTLETEIEHFVETLSGRTPPLVSGIDGLSALRVANMVHKEIEHDA